jgi:hypothetical protein
MYPYLYTQFSRKNNMSITKDEMVAALKEASKLGYLGGMGGGGGGGTSGGGGGGDSGSGRFGKELGAAGDAAKGLGTAAAMVGSKLAEGGARVSDATDALAAGFGGLGATGSAFGTVLEKGSKALGSLGQNLDKNIDTWRKLSDTGLSFNNDVLAMKDQASAARMSIAEMGEVMQKNNSSMLGFGATSAASAKQLSKMSDTFFTSGLGEQLRGMGYTTKELNDVLAVSISGSKIKDLNDKDSQAKALKSASALATEMDAVAKITGQSKQEQLDDLRRKATDGQRMAAIDEAIAKGGEGAKEAFDAISANGKLMGPQFQKLAEDMASMGRPSEGMEAAYGLLSSGAKKLMSEAGDAARSGNRERAAELTKQAAAEQAAFQNTSQYRTMAAQAGIKETQESYAQGAKFRNALEAAGKELGPMATDSEKTAAALKKLDEQVKAEQQAGGKDDPNATGGQAITKFAVDVESRGRDLTKTINDKLIQPLGQKDVGPAIAKLYKALNLDSPTVVDEKLGKPIGAGYDKARLSRTLSEEAGDKSGPNTGIGEKDKGAKDAEALYQLLNGNQKQSDAALKVIEKIANEKSISKEDVIKGAAANKGAGLADLVNQIKKELPATEQPGYKDAKKAELEKSTGKLVNPGNEKPVLEGVGAGIDALGGLFRSANPGYVKVVEGVKVTGVEAKAVGGIIEKPELILAGEAGPEAIFNKTQLENYTAKIMGAAAGAMPKMDTPKLDLSSMSKSISTSISSVSGGGETTTKRVQNDDSKAAEKELASVKEQMLAERNALREKLKAQIGDGSKLGGASVAKEMRTGEEGKGIADKYKAMIEPLQKQIDAGISFETTKKAAAIEETTKMVSEQLAITKTSNSTLADMYKDDSKSKLERLKQTNSDAFKEAELAKGVIGTSVKGMSEDMINSMIPKGAKIEDYYVDMNDKIQSYSAETVAKMEKTAKDSSNVVESYSTTISSSSKKMATDIASSLPGTTSKTVAAPSAMQSITSMGKMTLNDDQRKIFDEMMSLNDKQANEKLESLKAEEAAANAANKAAYTARDALEERYEAEGKSLKDLSSEDKKRYDELTAQMNQTVDGADKARESIAAAERAESTRQNLQKMGYDVSAQQEEAKVKIVETNAEQIKSYIAESLPVKDMAAKQEEFQSQFTESQQKILDEYKGYSEGNRVAHAEAMESGIKEDTETAKIIAARISKMKADIGDRQATEEETAELANQEANKKLFERRVGEKTEMLDIMQNLEGYSAKRELELKQKTAKDVTAEDKKTNAITAELPVNGVAMASPAASDDQEAAKEKAADEAKSELARESKRSTPQDAPKRKMMSMADMMGGGLDIGPNGMPIMKKIDTAKNSIPAKPADADAAREDAKFKRQAEEKKAEAAKIAEKKPDSKAATKESTLSDVVSALNTLNKQMGQLIAVSEEGHKSTTKAAKSTAGNIYAR